MYHNETHWKEGNCKAYRPKESASMNIVIAYNESDWTVGWTSFLDGFTMYYQDKQEDPLDFKKSIQGFVIWWTNQMLSWY